MLMAAVAPLAVTQNVIQLDRDDAWYLHRRLLPLAPAAPVVVAGAAGIG
jgi:hypothetical protein